MNVALTGASGFIGASAARVLAESGHAVTSLVRASSKREHIAPYTTRYVQGDQADASVWPDLLRGADALIHNSVDWAPLRASPGTATTPGSPGGLEAHLQSNLVGAIRLMHAAVDAGVMRIVFVSSVAVHHAICPRWKGVIDEDHPTRPRGLYGAAKAATEAFLWDLHARRGAHAVAIRPAAVYGVEPVNVERSHGHKQLMALKRGERVTKQNFGGGGKFVHIDDVATAIVRAVERDAASGHAFHLADCYAKFTRFAEHGAALLGLDSSMVEPDDGPPAKNVFSKELEREVLGVEMNRGDNGLREHMRELVERVG